MYELYVGVNMYVCTNKYMDKFHTEREERGRDGVRSIEGVREKDAERACMRVRARRERNKKKRERGRQREREK